MRRTSRRRESPPRIAAVMSDWSRSRRDTGVGYLGRSSMDARGAAGLVAAGLPRSAGLRSGVLLALGFLALPLHGWLLVVLAAASLGEDAALLDLLVEAAEGAFERLVLSHSDFSQSVFTSSDQGLAFVRVPARGRPARTHA